MTGKRFRIAFIFLVFTGVAVHASHQLNPVSRTLHAYCADYLLRHPIGCYRVDYMWRMGENHYRCKICRGLRSYGHENLFDYDDYYDNTISWDRNFDSKPVEKVPTIDQWKTVADVEEKTISNEIVKVDASHTDKETYERYKKLYGNEAKSTNLSEISTESEEPSSVREGMFLEKNTKAEKPVARNENKEPVTLFSENPISKITEVKKLVPVTGKSTMEEIMKTEATTTNSVFVSDESVKDITVITNTDGAKLESRLEENSTYVMRNTTTELNNDTKVEVIDLKEVTDGNYEGITQNTTAEESITGSIEPNNEVVINLTSVLEVRATEVITVSKEINGTTEEINETVTVELETTTSEDLTNYTSEPTIQALVTNVTVEDETIVRNSTLTTEAEEVETTIHENNATETETIILQRTTKESVMTTAGKLETKQTANTTKTEINATEIITPETESSRPQRITGESEITTGRRLDTKQTENTPRKEITTLAYSKKQELGISSTVSVETLSNLEISGVKTLRLVVSVLFLAIGLIATVVLTIYMIKVKRRTIAYDQLKLLP